MCSEHAAKFTWMSLGKKVACVWKHFAGDYSIWRFFFLFSIHFSCYCCCFFTQKKNFSSVKRPMYRNHAMLTFRSESEACWVLVNFFFSQLFSQYLCPLLCKLNFKWIWATKKKMMSWWVKLVRKITNLIIIKKNKPLIRPWVIFKLASSPRYVCASTFYCCEFNWKTERRESHSLSIYLVQ